MARKSACRDGHAAGGFDHRFPLRKEVNAKIPGFLYKTCCVLLSYPGRLAGPGWPLLSLLIRKYDFIYLPIC
jgi:hypothetical protein